MVGMRLNPPSVRRSGLRQDGNRAPVAERAREARAASISFAILDALAVAHHSGARAYGAGGAVSPFPVVPTISIISLGGALALGREAAYQHRLPSRPGALMVQDGHP